MITSETPVREFEKSQPLPSFRLKAPNTNPFVPSFPASVTGTGPGVQFNWGSGTVTTPSPGDESGRMSAMVENLRREVARFPKSAGVRVNLATALVNISSLDEAEAQLRSALEIEPQHYLARINLGHLLAHAGKLEEAGQVYNDLLAERPADNTVLLSLAVIALRRSDFKEAEEKLRIALANKEGNATVHFLLGLVQLCMNNSRGAVNELREASRLDVRNPTIHQALGVIFAVRSDFERAEHEFRAALMLAPNDRASLSSLYQVLLRQKKTAEAVDLLKRFVDTNPDDVPAREALALGLIDLKQFSSARFHMEKMLAKAGPEARELAARVQANIGLSYFLEGKPEASRTALKKAIAIDSNVSPIAYENLARLYLSQDYPEGALEVLSTCVKLFPESTAGVTLLSHVYSLLEETELAIKTLDGFRRRHEDNPVEVYVYLSFFYTQTLDLEACMEVTAEGLQKFPHSGLLLNNLAYVYAMSNRIEEARAVLKRIPKDVSVPFPVELTATRGLLRLREGDEKQGIQLYESAETLARETGNKELVRRVRQKKHLEVARFAIGKGDLARAGVEIKKGLAIHPKYFSYTADLLRLSEEMGRIAAM
jgi:tetratricopeptide (TPR) repeat protein